MACVEWTWEGLVAKCKRIRQTYAPDIEIPSTSAPDVLQVFDYTEVQNNVFRFVTYI